MTRQRNESPGGIHHVSTRGNNGRAIFEDGDDRLRFLEILAVVTKKHAWVLHAYCLMGNHYHLLVETPEPDLGAGMRHLNGRYAVRFNRRNGRKEHLFGERYFPVTIRSDAHLLEAARYIVLNPVRAGLCRRPQDWLWSSYRATVGEIELAPFLDPTTLLSLFADDPHRAHLGFRRFVGDGLPERASHESFPRGGRWSDSTLDEGATVA
jgi:REP element-mobilizing transposase RayT